MAFTRVCSLDDIPSGKTLKVDPAGLPLLALKEGEAVHVSSRVCLHRGADLSQGLVEGSVIMCPLHFWKFDVKTGACVQVPQVVLKTYPVTIENNEVKIDV